MFDRREFLRLLGGAGLTWPAVIDRLRADLGSGGAPDDQDYWDQVRSQFLIPEDRIYLNTATLGATPRVVLRAVEEHARRVAETFPPGIDWTVLKAALSEFLAGDPEGFVVTRNTTEAMNFVAAGLGLGAGDEVLTTDHEHIGGLCPWQSVCARRGATLRTLELPVPAESAHQLYSLVEAELAPATRVLTLSHVTFTTGTILPMARIAALCADRGVILVVDGAHPPGMLPVDLDRLGGDFYASSPHKWLLAPQGTGLLYLGGRWRTELWPTIASGGWDDAALGADRLNHVGTIDESRAAGLLAAIEFQRAIGVERIAERNEYLRARLRSGLEAIDGVRIASSADPVVAAPMTSFTIEGVDSLDLQSSMAQSHRIRTRVIGEYGYGWMRISTHIYNSAAEVDLVLELVQQAARNA